LPDFVAIRVSCWIMHQVWLLVLAVTGCATSSAFGAQAIATPNGEGSLEATVAGGVGLGTPDGAVLVTAGGALGASPTGDLQGRLQLSDEWVAFGTDVGWQLRAGFGGSFGSYQKPGHDRPAIRRAALEPRARR